MANTIFLGNLYDKRLNIDYHLLGVDNKKRNRPESGAESTIDTKQTYVYH